jgi:hypothetical protein
MPSPIFVVCDRCRAEGLVGDDPFEAFGALLDFDPVPRKTNRADGWDAEVQRAYIAALSLTGNDRAACRAVGKSAFGVTQLLAHEGSESFTAAREEALAIAADERSRRLAEGLRTVAAEQADWRPPPPPWSRGRPPLRALPAPAAMEPGPEEQLTPETEKVMLEMFEVILHKYLLKLQAERECRLKGEIAAADFYLRQITCLEVALDVTSGDGMALLKDARIGGHDLLIIAETPLSKLLDEARRDHWERCGDPPRPPRPCHLLEDEGACSTEPLHSSRGGDDFAARARRDEALHARDAEAQIAWEAEARADWSARRADGRITDSDIAAAARDEEHWLDAAVRKGEAMERAEAEARSTASKADGT